MSSRPSRQQLEQAFRAIDTNNSGNIEQAELEAVLKQYNHTPQEIKRFIDAVDKNHDGKINIQEFLNIFQ